MTDIVVILTTVPDSERGEAIARTLVEERLAACVNVLAPMTSLYRWKGSIERAAEHQLIIKTTGAQVSSVEARLRELHPYELPEFLVIDVSGGGAAYLDWLRGACG
jgi:periplasmic divalent cation tolerance protein